MNEQLSADELLSIFNKQWATTKDIMKIGCMGENRALKIKREITKKIYLDGDVLPRNKVPMEDVIKIFRINIDFLKKVSGNYDGRK